jgi:site-specific DNA recombinase
VRLINEDIESNCVEANQQLETIVSELSDAQSRLGKLYEAVETGKVSLDDLSPRIKELRTRQDKLLQTKAELENQIAEQRIESIDSETSGWYVQELAGLLDEGSLAERKAFLKVLSKRLG